MADCGQTLDVDRIVTEHGEQKAMIEAIIEAKLSAILKKHGLRRATGLARDAGRIAENRA